jgi:1-acyl-sn-glycerol-3-phosphate acyltransferase
MLFGMAHSAGLVARLLPARNVTARIARVTARWLIRLSGHQVAVEGAELISRHEPQVLVANRAGRLDPLVLAASIPSPFRIADATVLAGLPPAVAFLLKPMLIDPVSDEVAPPGGTLRQRICRALEEGQSVLVFADSPPGAPAHLSRFRLDAIHSAVVTRSRIAPIGIRGTSRILQPTHKSAIGEPGRGVDVARVSIGEPIQPEITDHRELVDLRERVRDAIAKLCR